MIVLSADRGADHLGFPGRAPHYYQREHVFELPDDGLSDVTQEQNAYVYQCLRAGIGNRLRFHDLSLSSARAKL